MQPSSHARPCFGKSFGRLFVRRVAIYAAIQPSCRLAVRHDQIANMRNGLHMRLGRPADARAIGVLARRVTRRWILPEQPADAAAPLLAGMSAQAIRRKIRDGQRFHLAFVGEALAGVAAIREDSHVFQLFVGTRHQGQGIARKLWQRVLKDSIRRAGTRYFTLNAAVGAVPVYLRLGFEPNASAKVPPSKLVTVPMIYRVRSPRHRLGRSR